MYEATERPSAPSTTTAVSSSFSPMTAATDVDVLGHGAAVGQRLGQQRRDVAGAGLRGVGHDVGGELLELLVLRDEVGLAVELDHRAVGGGDQAVGRAALGAALLDLGLALDAQQLGGLVEVAVGLLEGLLAAIMPAPVASRSFLTSAAVMFAMSSCVSLSCRVGRWCAWARCRPARWDRPAAAAQASRGALGGAGGRLGSGPRSAGASAAGASAAGCLGRGSLGVRAQLPRPGAAVSAAALLGGRRLGAGALDGLALRPGCPRRPCRAAGAPAPTRPAARRWRAGRRPASRRRRPGCGPGPSGPRRRRRRSPG